MVAAVMGNGHIGLVEEEVPAVRPGTVLVEVHSSLVSPGTELGSWRGLRARMDHPDPAAEPRRFGYSNSGVVLEAGPGVKEFRPGDRVAAIGAGYAQHTDYAVVPHHLCTRLPDNVTCDQGSYAMLAATGLHALRRGEPEFGEYVAVVGLGIVGQLTARLYQLAGNYVIGWDTIPFRTQIARRCSADAAVLVGEQDPIAATNRFTDGMGLDAAVLAFGGNADKAYESVVGSLKCSPDGHRMGRIIVVGGATFTVPVRPANFDIRSAGRTGSGYHDDPWEVGPDYPPVFMRWTTRTNLALVIRLISEGKLNVDALTTHRIPLDNVESGVLAIMDRPDEILGVVFQMKS